MRTLLSLVMVFGLAGFVAAEDKKADAKKGDPTGTWKWEMDRQGQKVTQTLTLKLDGDKLTGEMPGRGNNPATKIEDGTFKDGEVSFTVTRTMGDNKFVTKYKGKVDGDTLKLTAETDRNGQTNKREIEAKREEKKDK